MNNGIFLLLGTNLGDRLQNLTVARLQINSNAGKIIRKSQVYETLPWGVTEQPNYLNQVVEIETLLSPDNLLGVLLQIEKKMGRVRKDKWEARIMDIDILFYSNNVIQTEGLTIPHPRLHERNFTLIPLAELNPTLIHPVLNKSINELLDCCPDTLSVLKFDKG